MSEGSVPAVVYAAKSTEDKHGSIPDQLADGRNLAAARGFDVVAEYQDEAASAYHGDRGPGLAAGHGRVRAPQRRARVLCADRPALRPSGSRRRRSRPRHLIEFVLWAIKSDVRARSAFKTRRCWPAARWRLLLGAIGGMRNHQDSKRKGLAVKGGIRRRAVERRQFVGGRRPYGYVCHLDTSGEGGRGVRHRS